MVAAGLAGAELVIDLDALVANWWQIADLVRPAACAGVVKADGYGLGAAAVARALAGAGCKTFFVAHPQEGIALREALPAAVIYVLHGALPGAEDTLAAHRLIPALSSLSQIAAWQALAKRRGPLAAALHVDTGMNRLGLGADDVDALAAEAGRLEGIDVKLVMSHLACAEETDHPLNRQQRDRFEAARRRLPAAPASLANSSGVFLGPAYHYDLVRPGIALYGGNPLPDRPNPIRQVIRLQGRILQVRRVDSPMTVGYGATHRVARPGRIATVSVGYADGYLRALSNKGVGVIGDQRVPVVGRVSMDLIAVDVTDIDRNAARRGHMVTLIGDGITVDELAHHFGTIGYEVLTSLGRRFARVYKGGEAMVEPPAPATPETSVAAEPAPTTAAPPPVPGPPPVPSETASADKA